MKRKITSLKVLIAFILTAIGILILFNIVRPHIKLPKVIIPSDTHICTDPQHITCDGECECDGFECSLGINSEDSLIADETYIVTDTIGIGYTFNQEVANILIEQGCKINYIDGDYIWFSFDEIPNIP